MKTFDDQVKALAHLIAESKRVVFFGGAGVSTESGIPDFRSVDGLYHQVYDYPPETILSGSFLYTQPSTFFRFYKDKMVNTQAKPNDTHRILAKLEQEGRLLSVVTQNIDGLHQAAGAKRVHELHGSVHRNYCVRCGKTQSLNDLMASPGVPQCLACGGMVRPDVVLYQEGLSDQVLNEAIADIKASDLLIVGGTSLLVYPAASLVHYHTKGRMVIINQEPTPADRSACLCVYVKLGQVFRALDGLMDYKK